MQEAVTQRHWIGNACDAARLSQRAIAVIVDLAANEAPARRAREAIYCRIPIVDGAGNTRAPVKIGRR